MGMARREMTELGMPQELTLVALFKGLLLSQFVLYAISFLL